MYTQVVLSTKTVIQAGVDCVRERGLESLGVRALAERLGVTPMALYRHVDTAGALEDAVVDDVLSSVPAVVGAGGWTRAARAWAIGARRVFAGHPGVARHVLTHWFRLPRALDWIEGLLAAAARDRMAGALGVAAANAVFTYVLMRAEAEEGIRRAGVVHRKLPRGARSALRWPRLKANAGEYEVARLDRHFEFGLDALLCGIERRNEC
jgi:AcrR family transcriptional regulator